MINLVTFLKRVPLLDNKDCWLWKGGVDRNGYGRLMGKDRKYKFAHRISYQLFKGEIPIGLQLDHLCRKPLCVNPFHLEAVTSKENTLRGESPQAKNAKKTHCIRGHALFGKNLIIVARGRSRACRICSQMHWNKYSRTKRKKVLIKLSK